MSGVTCPPSEEDAPQYTAWLNDLEVARNLTVAVQTIAIPGEREYLRQHATDHTYSIVTHGENRIIGNVGLVDINHLERTGEVGVFIGAEDLWGQGYGREAMELLMHYAFDYLNIRNIWLRVYAFNERAIASYRKLGFREVGRRRKAVPREGVEHDLLFMDILDEEFFAIHGHTSSSYAVFVGRRFQLK